MANYKFDNGIKYFPDAKYGRFITLKPMKGGKKKETNLEILEMEKMKDLITEVRAELVGWPQELIPENLEELIGRLYDTDNRKVGRLARKEEDRGEFSFGLIKTVKETIQKRNRLNQAPAKSYQEARIDRIRFITNFKRKKNPQAGETEWKQ